MTQARQRAFSFHLTLAERTCLARGKGSFFFLLLCLMIGGCAAVKGFPDPVVDTTTAMTNLKDYLDGPAVRKKYEGSDTDRGGMSRKEWRNEVLEAHVHAVDLKFGDFERALYKEGIGWGIGTDWTVLALTGAAAVSTGNAPKYLAAAAAGLVGGQAAYQKSALFDKTLPALMAQMAASRRTILVLIRQGEGKGTDEYPLDQGLNDVNEYENAGTIPGAISGVTSNAGAQLKQATESLNKIQVVSDIAPPDVQARREALSDYVKGSDLTPSQLAQLVTALGKTPGADADADTLTVLYAISAATTAAKFDAIAQQVKIHFGKVF